MKILIPVVFLLTLYGCDGNGAGSHDSVNIAALPESTVVANGTDDRVKVLKGHVSRAGLYRMVRSGGLINDPSTSTGKSVSKPVVELVRSTDRIPLIKGAQMYLQYRIWPLPAQPAYADLRRVLRHPAMNLPDGLVSTGSDYMIKGRVNANQVIGYTGYGFDEDYELVEGDWTFEVWYQGSKLIAQTFTTYRPDKAEIARLKPILELGNRAIGQSEPAGKSFSKFNFPRINIGGTQELSTATSINESARIVE